MSESSKKILGPEEVPRLCPEKFGGQAQFICKRLRLGITSLADSKIHSNFLTFDITYLLSIQMVEPYNVDGLTVMIDKFLLDKNIDGKC